MTPIVPDRCASEPAASIEATPARRARLGSLEIRRALPIRERRLVGPWCFLDRYGPVSFRDELPMELAPHPHIGIQTASWLLDGEILHRDSLGSEVLLRPGGLNLMTAGSGIAHSEDTPLRNSGRLSGVQLWIALPEAARNTACAFEHHPSLPEADAREARVTVFAGALAGAVSPATSFAPIVGADVAVGPRARLDLPLDREFEHALFVLDGEAAIDRERLEPDVLYYLGVGRDEVCVESSGGARMLLLGGRPFGETILMWWNFVARTHEEIVEAAEDWRLGRRFGRVPGYDGPPMATPPLRGRVQPPAAS